MIRLAQIIIALLVLPAAVLAEAVPVEVVRDGDGFALLRGGEPYTIKGVGAPEGVRLDLLADVGGNSIRTWGDDQLDDGKLLDRAHDLGLTVVVGFWLKHKPQGADYEDEAFKTDQRERFRAVVERYKDHPAVLMWGIGNESEAAANTPAYWRHVNDLAHIAKELDPHHPTMTVTAEIGGPGDGRPGHEAKLAELAPLINVWGINSYRGMYSLVERLERRGVDRPWVVCEWGANGPWEVARAEWGVPLEQSSTEKAAQMAYLQEKVIAGSSDCLGGYAFAWNKRPAATHTWFGLLTDEATPTELVDVLQRAWTGAWPDDQGPKVLGLELPTDRVRPGERVPAVARAYDPEGRPVAVRWHLATDRHAPRPKRPKGYEEDQYGEADLTRFVDDPAAAATSFVAPETPGPYRLYLFVVDASGKTATANVPFLVDPDASPATRPAAAPVLDAVAAEPAEPTPDPTPQ